MKIKERIKSAIYYGLFLFQVLVKVTIGTTSKKKGNHFRSTYFLGFAYGGNMSSKRATIVPHVQCASWVPNNLPNLFLTFRRFILQFLDV